MKQLKAKKSQKRHYLPSQKVKFKLADQQRWFSLLVELLDSGFSLKEAVLFSQTIYPEIQPILKDITHKMEIGYSFAKAIQAWVAVDTYYQVQLAEEHGQLFTTLRYFSQYIKVRLQQAQKLKHLLEYPAILICLLTGIISMMFLLVLPQLTTIENNNQGDEWNSIIQPTMWLLGSIVTVIIYKICLFKRMVTICKVRQLCRLPVVGKMYQDYYGYYFCSNLSILLLEGLSLQKIIAMCKTFDKESFLYQICEDLNDQLVNGTKNVFSYIYDENFIPNELAVLVRQGMSTDHLGKQVQSLGNHLFKRMVMECEQKLVFIQPVIYLVIALIIIGLYLKILMPIYQTVQVMK